MNDNESVKILMVDDRPENLLALESILDGQGYTLVRADSGRDALRHLMDEDFAVILLDVQMPKMDGFETAMMIKDREQTRHIPIIFLTAIETSEARAFKGYMTGAVDYLYKPFVPAILKAKIAVFVDLYRKTAEVKRQLESIRLLNAQLQVANGELEAFARMVSHDLRAPLRHMQGFAQMLETRHAALLDEEGKGFIRHISNAAQQMDRLIEDLLKLSRVTISEMTRAPVDLSALVFSILSSRQASEPQRRVECVVAPGVQVVGDGPLLRVALENLLGNAWKFTGRKEQARIEFGVREEKNARVYFVRDDGAGFKAKYVDKLFQPFQRLHGSDQFPGTGIGLSIVQRVVARHGGRIWAEGEEDKGATFSFTLG